MKSHRAAKAASSVERLCLVGERRPFRRPRCSGTKRLDVQDPGSTRPCRWWVKHRTDAVHRTGRIDGDSSDLFPEPPFWPRRHPAAPGAKGRSGWDFHARPCERSRRSRCSTVDPTPSMGRVGTRVTTGSELRSVEGTRARVS